MKELPDNVISTLKQINFLSFPFTKRALRVLGTIPVTLSTYERSFSAMKLLKTYLWTTMANNRLTALPLLYVHTDIYPSSEEFLQKYVALGLHRMKLD